MRRLLLPAVSALLLAACTSTTDTDTTPSSGPTTTTPSQQRPSDTGSSAPHTSRPVPSSRPVDWPQYHRTPDRHGVSPDMPTFTDLRVRSTLKLDGAMYASPVVVDATIIAATEGDTVYAYGVDGHKIWERHLGTPSPATERPCGNIDPLGITGTPIVADETVYMSPELTGPIRHELVALDVATGAVKWRRNIDLPGVEIAAMQERGALAISGGRVWVPFGGLAGDCGGYKGRVVGVKLDGSGQPIAYTVPTTREAGIWTPPGPAVDDTGQLFVAVGNGESGVGDPYDHSDSVLKLSSDGKLLDSFSPKTWPTDNDNDLDLGSQGPALVGRWVFQAGKSGTAYVLDRDHLGGIGGQVSNGSVCASYGGTAVMGNVVYVPCDDGDRAVSIDSHGSLRVLWHVDSDTVAGSPVIGGGRVWTLDQNAGVLHALDPKTGDSLAQVDVGVTSRFATPAIYGRDVLVPTMTGLTIVETSG